jgi:hypothetical protein
MRECYAGAMRTLVALSAIALCTHNAPARLGESVEQIEQRYGKPIQEEETSSQISGRKYKALGFVIAVMFFNGKSEAESFTKPTGEGIVETEIEAILKANGSGGEWTRVDKIGSAKTWKLGDSTLAYFAPSIAPPTFIVMTKEMGDYLRKLKIPRDLRLYGFDLKSAFKSLPRLESAAARIDSKTAQPSSAR